MNEIETTKQTALITGCTSGIGKELAEILAARGHDLVLVSRNRAKLDALATELTGKYPVETHVVAAELDQAGSAQAVFAETESRSLVIDILVNNAGIGMYGAIADVDVAAQSRMIQLNSVTPSELCAFYAKGMSQRGRGQILNIASTVAYQPTPWMAAYGASKAFLLSYSEALAKELDGHGVTVTAVSPGPTKTEFFGRLDANAGTVKHFAGENQDTARRVAEVAMRALDRGRLSKIVGAKNFWLASSSRFAPRSLVAKISKSLMAPRSVTSG
ncbi:MAG TPA: SDR family oxidoreductase [Kofleriaceae bacterium]